MNHYPPKVKLIYVVLFLILIALPLLGLILNAGGESLKDFRNRENRDPSRYPNFPNSIAQAKDFPAAFESAFSDHLPFRDFLIDTCGKLSVRLLDVSFNHQLLIGKNGHCFLASHGNGNNDLIFDSIEMAPQQIAQEIKQLRAVESFLTDLNIPAVLVAIPTSPLFEFHNLPTYIQRKIDISFLKTPPAQRIINGMSTSFSEKYLLYPYAAAEKANKVHPLFPEKNFHWKTGRFTKLTAACIAAHFGIAPYQDPGMDEFVTKRTVSDLSRFAGTKLYNANDLVYPKGTWEKLNIRKKKVEAIYKNYPEFPYSYFAENPSKKQKILLVGDSFAPALRLDLARYFKEVLTVNFNLARDNPNLSKWFSFVFKSFKPDYIVFLNHNKFMIFDEFIDNFYLMQRADADNP